MKKIFMMIIGLLITLGLSVNVYAASEGIGSTSDAYSSECEEEDSDCSTDGTTTTTTTTDNDDDSETCLDCETSTTENPKTAGEATFILGAIGSLGAAKVFISASNKKKRI